MQVASSFAPKIGHRPVDVVPRGEEGTRDGKEETVMITGAGAGAGIGENKSTGMNTRAGMWAGIEIRAGRGDRIMLRTPRPETGGEGQDRRGWRRG